MADKSKTPTETAAILEPKPAEPKRGRVRAPKADEAVDLLSYSRQPVRVSYRYANEAGQSVEDYFTVPTGGVKYIPPGAEGYPAYPQALLASDHFADLCKPGRPRLGKRPARL